MRRWVIVFVLLALPVPAFAREKTFELSPGEAVFWAGPHVESSSGGDVWTYRLRLRDTGFRLRVGFDHPQVDDTYQLRLTDPGGQTSTMSSGDGLYSAEFLEMSPRAGTWRVEVRTTDVTDSAFRLRAKLEARPPGLGTDKGAVLPNLQVLPPHEATFLMPVSNGGTPGDSVGLDLQGAESCHPEEHVEDRAVRCLRFAFGIRNTGLGPLQLSHAGPALQDHDLVQRVQRGDDSYFERAAGVARYHKTHGHYHHHDAVALRLFEVTDRAKGVMVAAGEKHFKGFAHRNELLRDWDGFYPTWPDYGFGLRAGWADIYEWDRPGNYTDFGLNGDGFYVLRMWADPVKGVLESNERDNAGYTYFRVAGSAIELLEAGRGRDPWDPCKIEVGFGGYPDPPRRPRPASCPADTT